MGVVNTTYTFTSTDTITSAKMNNIIDETTFTGDAIQGTTLQVVSPGKLAVSAGGITSNELASSAVTQAKLGTNVVGNGPVFFASSSSNQTLPNGVDTKVTLNSEGFDTNSNFLNSRFTPTVAGYYMITGSVGMTDNLTEFLTTKIFKNGGEHTAGVRIAGAANISTVSNIIYMNGSTDFIELYVRQATGVSKTISAGSNYTFISGCLVRSA
jgi:hypothetical protein